MFIKARFGQFIYGFYPVGERWRVNTAFVILVLGLMPLFLPRVRHKIAIAAALLVVYPVVAYYLFHGGAFGLRVVETSLWGGLFLTLVIAGVGIVASLPLGILFALGRRSEMPIVRAVCITFIEVMRGVPLITDPVHGLGDAAAVPAGRGQLRQAAARAGRRRAVLGRLHGGGRARRLAGDP